MYLVHVLQFHSFLMFHSSTLTHQEEMKSKHMQQVYHINFYLYQLHQLFHSKQGRFASTHFFFFLIPIYLSFIRVGFHCILQLLLNFCHESCYLFKTYFSYDSLLLFLYDFRVDDWTWSHLLMNFLLEIYLTCIQTQEVKFFTLGLKLDCYVPQLLLILLLETS